MKAIVIALIVILIAGFAFAAHPQESHGEKHEASTFLGLPSWIWKLLNMLVFFGLLGWVLRGPIGSGLAARHQQVLRETEEARERRAKADQMAADISKRLTQVEEEVRLIAERAKAEGEKQKRELIAAAEAEAQKILQSARNEVDNRVKLARKELTEYAGELASDRAEQLLREKITDADRQKLFRESVNDVERARS